MSRGNPAPSGDFYQRQEYRQYYDGTANDSQYAQEIAEAQETPGIDGNIERPQADLDHESLRNLEPQQEQERIQYAPPYHGNHEPELIVNPIQVERPEIIYRNGEVETDPKQNLIITIEASRKSIDCDKCGYRGDACSYYAVGWGNFLVAIILLLLWWPLFWIPFFVKYLKDDVFECPQCGLEHSRRKFVI